MALSKEELEKLGVADQDTVQSSAFARVLVMGPAKAGKTTCILSTAPKPLHINCDGVSASMGAVNQNAKFLSIDANSKGSLERALQAAEKLVAAGEVKTVVLDTITLLGNNLLGILGVTLDGYDLWNELQDLLVGAVKRLVQLEAHVFVVAHMMPDKDDKSTAGVMPMIGGQSKVWIPALLDDWILLDVEPGRKPERQWLLGPQKSWNHSGRNIRKTAAVPATVPALFDELGIDL